MLWCGLNDEADTARAAHPRRGERLRVHEPRGEGRALLDSPTARSACWSPSRIAAFGLNFQHCARMVFVGLSDSYEAYYQAIRRCYRYGQTRVVHAHVVLSELEAQIAANVRRKEREAPRMTAELVRAMRAHQNTRQEVAA